MIPANRYVDRGTAHRVGDEKSRRGAVNAEQVERHLRYQIVGLLHVGRVKRGVPLPSIRGVARSLGVDHRLVAAAYRRLAAEGLVEIRPGAGVFLAGDVGAGAVQGEAEAWLAGVLLDGWNRGIARAELGRMVARCASAPVRCACVESNEDHMVAVAAELEEGFSLEVRPVPVSPVAGADVPAEALADAGVVVTTVFHAAEVRRAAAAAGKPCVVLRAEPAFAANVASVLNAVPRTTAIIADPRYSARALAYLDATPHRGRVRFVTLDELAGAGVDPQAESTLITRAARRRLGFPEYHLVPPPPGYISSESAAELCQAIVALSPADATMNAG